jgi:glutathione S-transferase
VRLYDNHGSTNALKVRVLLEELGLECERVEVPLQGDKPAGYTELHPFAMVPLLVDGYVVVSESNVALRYLAEREGRADLRGATPAERARIDVLLDSLSLEVRPALLGVEEFAVYGARVDDEDARVSLLEGKLGAYDRLLDAGGPWATGATFTIADCALAGRALHLPVLPLDAACAPRLRGILAGLARRPAYRRATAG